MGTKQGTRKDLFPGALELMVLQTLKRRPLHGYALVRAIQASSRDLLQIEEGSLYPALQRMLKESWVKARWTTSSTGRRVRIYAVTPKGLKHLSGERERLGQMFEGVRLVLAIDEP
ncbi:MAG: PadR family transcriptional regulator [Vicinamibacterales bacterium]